MVGGCVVGARLEAVAVEHLHFTAMPARSDRLGSVTGPHLHVRHVVLLLLHCNNNNNVINNNNNNIIIKRTSTATGVQRASAKTSK